MPAFEFDQTPIAVLMLDVGTTTSPFADENAGDLANRYAGHLIKAGSVDERIKGDVADALTSVMGKHPRTVKQRMLSNISIVDRMKVLAGLPEELANLFEDGMWANLDSRRLSTMMSNASRDKRFKRAFGMHTSTDSRKIQYGRLTVPKAAPGLSGILSKTFAELAVPAVLDMKSDASFDIIHFFDYGRKQDTTMVAVMQKLVASPIPFTLGAAPMMLSPEAWAILSAIGFHVFGNRAVKGGNGAKPKRPNTKGLRTLPQEWSWAIQTRIQFVGIEPPYGYHDYAAISQRPSEEVMDELRAYTVQTLSESAWSGGDYRSMETVIQWCLLAAKRKSYRDHLKEKAREAT